MKLLVATEFPPNAPGGGPAVVRQMLANWPSEDLFWWSCLPEHDRHFGQSVAAAYSAPIPLKLLPHRQLTRAKSTILEKVWAPLASSHLQRTIERVRPDAVWLIPHNWAILPLSKVFSKSSVGHHVTMQDYVDVHGQAEKFGPWRCQRMAELADRLYAAATTRDATSHPMLEDLRTRTGEEGAQMLHAGLEEADFQFLELGKATPATGIRIAYAGTILAKKEFALFVEALGQLRSTLPVSIELFSAHSYAGETWFDGEWMHENGNLPEPELLASLRTCTWGFVPMSLGDNDPRYNRFSFPTKFISYLAAGLPMVMIGHRDSSVMKMAAQYEVGISGSPTNVEDLMTLIGDSLAKPDPRFRSEILRCARLEFDANRMRARLYECLRECSEHTRFQRAARTRR